MSFATSTVANPFAIVVRLLPIFLVFPTGIAVQIVVGDKPIFVTKDAMAVLEQIEGAIAYVDTLAPRPAAQRFKQLRATLEGAYTRLHERLHQQGHFHRHTALHSHDQGREH